MRLAAADGDVVQTEFAHPLAQAAQIFGHDVFREDAAVGTDDGRQSHDVIAAARADVRDGHSGPDAEQPHKLLRLAGSVTLLLVMPYRADDVRHRAVGFWKR